MMACQPGIDEAKVAKIDSLQAELDSSQQKISAIDSAKMMDYSRHYFENINYIKTKFNDTIETETAFYIDKYYGMRKTMKLMQNQYSSCVEELNTTQQQLKDLKFDAKEGLLEDQQFDKYFALESENVKKIKSFVDQLQNAYEVSIPAFDEMNPTIDSLIMEDIKDKKKAKGVQS
jgi:hypothetical protein